MILYFLAVEAKAYVLVIFLRQSDGCAGSKGDTLVCGAEKALNVDIMLHDAVCIEAAKLCQLCACFIVARIDEIGGLSAALEGEITEGQHAAVCHEFDKIVFVAHFFYNLSNLKLILHCSAFGAEIQCSHIYEIIISYFSVIFNSQEKYWHKIFKQ